MLTFKHDKNTFSCLKVRAQLDSGVIHVIRNSLHLIQRHSIVAAVIEASGASGFMPSHLLRDFELAAIRKPPKSETGAAKVPRLVVGTQY